MQKVFDLLPTLLLCIQEAQLTNKVTDLVTVPTLHIHNHFRIFQDGRLERGGQGVGWNKMIGWVVLQYEPCLTAAIFRSKEEIVPSCNDAVQFLGYILNCISLADSSGRERQVRSTYLVG